MMLLGAVSPAVQVADFAGARWSKLALNCASSTLGAVGGVRLGALLRRRFVRRLVLEIWTEVAAVAAASGRTMVPIGGTFDIERMALTPEDRTRSAGSAALALKHALLLGIGLKYRSVRSSMLVALERGRSPEIDFLNGEVVRRGAKLRVPTPVNEQLVATVQRIFAGEERPSMNLLRRTFDKALTTSSARPTARPAARAMP
jgi:2-dehydropantoate 2-reductase